MDLTDRQLIQLALDTSKDTSMTPLKRLDRINGALTVVLFRFDEGLDAWASQDELANAFEVGAGDEVPVAPVVEILYVR